MKLSLWLIDIILCLSIFVPYYLFIRAGKVAEKKKLKTIGLINFNHGILPDIDEQWCNSYIGIHSSQKTLIHIRFGQQSDYITIFLLSEISSCILLKDHKRIKKNKAKEEMLTFLGIELSFIDSGKSPRVIPLYDIAWVTGEDYEVARAEKWMQLITRHIPYPISANLPDKGVATAYKFRDERLKTLPDGIRSSQLYPRPVA